MPALWREFRDSVAPLAPTPLWSVDLPDTVQSANAGVDHTLHRPSADGGTLAFLGSGAWICVESDLVEAPVGESEVRSSAALRPRSSPTLRTLCTRL